jgi:copper chaperone
MRSLAIEIEGMSCGGCVASVTRVLNRIAGVRVDDVKVGIAHVTLDDTAVPADLVRAIEKAGFKARVPV